MVDEITCIVCKQFPFKPLECRSCNKLFCQYCQIHLRKGGSAKSFINTHQQFVDRHGNVIDQPRSSSKLATEMVTPEYDICCPNCQATGDFMQEVNKVLRNCIDFCEFPHKCFNQKTGGYEIIWKTLGELQAHAQYSCPKFGCDICYREEF